MRRWPAVLSLCLIAFGLAAGCGLEETGSLRPQADGGGPDSSDDSHQVTDACFIGAKACPDGKGGLTCKGEDDPASGCLASTSCAPCVLPHATAKCSGAKGCDIDACDTGWSDCDADPSDGCETNLGWDPTHCGTCTTNCYVTTAPTAVCSAGKCVENPCAPPTLGNCDGDLANGCEVDLTTDADNCSFCGNVCQLPHASSACTPEPSGSPLARCTVKQCEAGWADCDGSPANGCESSAVNDPSTCGGCGKKCNSQNGVAGCVNGVCSLLCNSGFGNCDNDIQDGCETDLSTHPSHCGGCGAACSSANGTPTCVGGQCTTGGCGTGYADCDGSPGNGCETATTSDPDHCGACSTKCVDPLNGFGTCNNGVCGIGCQPGYSDCGSGTTCYDTTKDAEHCGTSCTPCPAPATGQGGPACSGGVCALDCAPGYSPCGASCVDLKTDGSNCGACGKVCTAAMGGTAFCQNAQCVVTCPTNVALCGEQCVDVYNDKNHCGKCNNPCGVNQKCSGGACVCPGWAPKNCGSYCAPQCCNNADCGGNWCVFGLCT